MKKLIHQTLAVTVFATSLVTAGVPAAFAQDIKVVSQSVSHQSSIRDIMAEMSVNLENGSSRLQAINETAIRLHAQNVSAQSLVEYVASGMEVSEGNAFRASMTPKLAQIQNGSADQADIAEMVAQVSFETSRGANYRSGCNDTIGLATGIFAAAAIGFAIAALNTNGDKEDSKKEIDALKLDKITIQNEIDVLVSQGLPESSFYVASLKADMAYIDELVVQEERKFDDSEKNVSTYSTIAGVSGALALGGFALCTR